MLQGGRRCEGRKDPVWPASLHLLSGGGKPYSDRETGIGNWTDDMLARAIREGVRHDGQLIDPNKMPYEFYRSMSDEDLASIIVYLRSIPPIRNTLPPPKAFNIVAPYAIPMYAPIPSRDTSPPVKWGAYLVQLGGC